ncbi:nuclear transport factor 2 family protein [Fluviicola sp.]|uniref:nuclear transport factor 2 family protein n=1 Tax=Fluviicola sp. TaxID=1917219 RepID=UPI0031D45BDC
MNNNDAQITKTDIQELEQLLLEAIKKSDTVFLDKVLHDDLLFIVPGGNVITKEMDLASHRAGEMVVEEIIPEIEQVTIIGDTGVVTIVYDSKGSMLGNPIRGKFRYIRFWKQFPDGLKVIGGSCTQLQ